MAGFTERLKTSFNILFNNNEIEQHIDLDSLVYSLGVYDSAWRDSADKVLAPVINKIAIPAAMVPIYHIQTNERGRFERTIDSELSERLNRSANVDQTGFDFRLDLIETVLREGHAVVVPVDVTTDPTMTVAYDPLSLRVGTVVEWMTKAVRVKVYNDRSGSNEEINLPKSFVSVIYNPMYEVMNRSNSTLRRLIDKLALLDISDNKISSPNLDLILQLPYSIRTPSKEKEASSRLARLEKQLFDNKYGVAYIDATEKITQLNRPVSNSLPEQVQYLEDKLNKQLGLTDAVLSGTAKQADMIQFHNGTVAPILTAIVESLERGFLSRTAISQGQRLRTFVNLFKMAPLLDLAEAADKLSRNEILSSNEIRSELGFIPDDDPKSDALINSNINQGDRNINTTSDTEPKKED